MNHRQLRVNLYRLSSRPLYPIDYKNPTAYIRT